MPLMCAALFVLPVFTACDSEEDPNKGKPNPDQPVETVDYVSTLHLDMSSTTKKQEVTVRLYVDGDTTHFNPVTNSTLTEYHEEDFAKTFNYIKARYLAVNTPESTGDIEKWGKTAADFTRKQLESADKIIVESDDDKWNLDSTGERYTLWIWYRPAGETEFRNLNVELLQNGYGRASSTGDTRYGTTAVAALAQAQAQKLHVFSPSSTKDPNFFDDDAVQIDLKTLRFRVEDYVNRAVRVEGVVTAKFGNTAYIQDYDAETDTCYGFAVYYGYQTGAILEVLDVGNRVSVHGKVSYYEAGDTYQISDVENNEFRPTSTTNSFIIEKNVTDASFRARSAKDIVSAGRTLSAQFEVVEDGEEKLETISIDYREGIMSTSVTLSDLEVIGAYTTKQGESKGAISLTCVAPDGTQIVVRTEVLKDANGNVILESEYRNKTITVKGIVDKYEGSYQVRVHRADYITIVG